MILYDTYRQITHPLSLALSEAQHRGVLIDVDARAELTKEMKLKITATLDRINYLTKSNLNPNSPKQVAELLYDKLHFPKMYSKKGGVTTDEESIKTLAKKYPQEEVLQLILQYRKDTKLVSTFLEVALDDQNCIHTSFNPSGTKNYRISSSQDLWGSGMNLQNIPKGKRRGVANIRNIFIARPGCSFVKADLRQAEAMVVARILCRYHDFNLWDKYAQLGEGFDIHKWSASKVLGIPELSVTKEQREGPGKIGNHAGNYCSGPRVVMSTATKWEIDGIDYKMAQRIIDSRHVAMPGLRKWWQDVEKTIRTTRTLTTCLGRRRQFFGRFDDNAVIRDAVAFEPQSTVGDVCNMMFGRMWQMVTRPALPLLQVHDEVVTECPDDYVPECVRLIRGASIVPLYLNKDLEPLIIPIDVEVGKNWRDCEAYV